MVEYGTAGEGTDRRTDGRTDRQADWRTPGRCFDVSLAVALQLVSSVASSG